MVKVSTWCRRSLQHDLFVIIEVSGKLIIVESNMVVLAVDTDDKSGIDRERLLHLIVTLSVSIVFYVTFIFYYYVKRQQ